MTLFTAITAGCALLLNAREAFSANSQRPLGDLTAKEQVVVFDAGSSGTRVHVYDFVWDGTVVPSLDTSRVKSQELKVAPGLSDLSKISDNEELSKRTTEKVKALLDFVRKFVPAETRKDTAIILKATAGLRMVPPKQAERILQAVRTLFMESEFYFRPHRGWADVISGVEEAGLAWISANYLGNIFLNGDEEGSVESSKGIVEMGGGSAQICYQIYDSATLARVDKERLFVFRDFHGQNHNVYAMSYLGFGRDHALRRFDKTLNNLGVEINPCHTKGYVAETGVPQMTGTGEYASCLALINEILFNSSMPDQPVVIPGSDPSAPAKLEGPFLATEVFYYLRVNSLGDSWRDYDLTPAKSQKLGNQLCEALEDSKTSGKTNASAKIDNQCFTVALQTAFLEKLGATGHFLPVVTKDVQGVQVEWALGAAVQYLASTVKERNKSYGSDSGDSLMASSILFMLAVSAFALLMIFALGRMVSKSQSLRIWATRSLRRRRRAKRSGGIDRSKYTKVSREDNVGDHTQLELEAVETATINGSIEMQISSRVARGHTTSDRRPSHDSEVYTSGQIRGLPAI